MKQSLVDPLLFERCVTVLLLLTFYCKVSFIFSVWMSAHANKLNSHLLVLLFVSQVVLGGGKSLAWGSFSFLFSVFRWDHLCALGEQQYQKRWRISCDLTACDTLLGSNGEQSTLPATNYPPPIWNMSLFTGAAMWKKKYVHSPRFNFLSDHLPVIALSAAVTELCRPQSAAQRRP